MIQIQGGKPCQLMRQLLGAFMDNASQEGMIEPLRLTGNGIQNFFLPWPNKLTHQEEMASKTARP